MEHLTLPCFLTHYPIIVSECVFYISVSTGQSYEFRGHETDVRMQPQLFILFSWNTWHNPGEQNKSSGTSEK